MFMGSNKHDKHDRRGNVGDGEGWEGGVEVDKSVITAADSLQSVSLSPDHMRIGY